MKRKYSLLIKRTFFILIGFYVINPLWGKNTMDNEALEIILRGRNTTIEIYSYPFGILTRFPLTEEAIRDMYYSKIYIRNRHISSVMDIILMANELPKDRRMNIRLLIDILVDDEIIQTIPISVGDGMVNEINKAFQSLFGL